jgi:very-short-patch-repair endonuclease
VIEVDGKQHYSKDDKPSPQLYSEIVAEDRRIWLTGYGVYRFGGWELLQQTASS